MDHDTEVAGDEPTGAPGAGTVTLARTCGHLLRLAHQRHAALWLAEVGTEPTAPQYALLEALAAAPGADQRGVGALASLDRSSTTDVVARLRSRGWVSRAPDPADGRRDILTLTDTAQALLDTLRPRVARVQERLLAPVPEREREPLLRDLATLGRIDGGGSVQPPPRLLLPGHLVRRAQQLHTALFAEDVGKGLTGPQYAVLHVLSVHPGTDQRTLGARAGLDRSTTADLVSRLERRGWASRDRDAADGRRQVLGLTPAGRSATAAATPRVAAVQERLLAPLDESERAAFLARLTRLAGLGTTG